LINGNTKYYELKFTIPKYYVRIISTSNDKIELDNISLSFPFLVSASFKFEKGIVDIAKETILSLIDRRILNAFECCANCINDALKSLKEIKLELISIKKQLKNNINSPLFYYIDYIVISINAFFDFMERNNLIDSEDFATKDIYFDALEMMRNHIAQCMFEIAKIGKMQIDNKRYAFKNGEMGWKESYYSEGKQIINITI